MAEFIETEEKVIDVNEPVIFENKTDSDFEVSAGIVFRKSGLYDVSIVGRRTIISKVEERKERMMPKFDPLHFIADQNAKADNGKAKLTLVPRRIIFDIARIREYGNQKYGDSENWKTVDIQRYRDAAFRHFLAYLDDPQGVDAESGLPHYWHLACNIAFICEMEDKFRGDAKKVTERKEE